MLLLKRGAASATACWVELTNNSSVTLRLRLTLFYTLLVALILSLTGIALHVFLFRSLLDGVDESLEEAASVVAAFTENEGGRPALDDAEKVAEQFAGDLVALLYDADGEVVIRLGKTPDGVPLFETEHATWGEWRAQRLSLDGGSLTVLRELEDTREAMRRFDLVYLTLAPLAVLAAFALGYALAGRALRPVDRLTRAAYDLANRRAWRERLPEPKQRDELKRLAQGTNELLTALEGVIESERRFTADAAHELRTPLTVLQGRLEQARERSREKEIVPLLDKALGANRDLLSLIEKLLTLARTEAGQGLPKERVALDEVAFDTAEALRPLFIKKGLALELHLPQGPVWVQGDRVSLGLLIRNLLENALKFTAEGEVVLEVGCQSNCALLSVSDTGPGIPEVALPQLFERFYQAEVTHRRTGSGLGLALVKSVAAWHGGEVRAKNGDEGGARFEVQLPLIS